MRRNNETGHVLGWSAWSALLLVLLSIVDYVTGPDVTLSLYYFLIVVLLAWKTGEMRLTSAAAVASAAVWLVAESLTHGAPSQHVLLLNGVTRLATLLGVGWTICRLKAALKAERALARTDFLTGTLNSRSFHEEANREIDRSLRYAHPLTICYFDLDGFKGVNDTLGHSKGNDALRDVAEALKQNLRSMDRVCRIGGDEFVILLPETGHERARLTVNRLQIALRSAMKMRGWAISASVGAASFETPPREVDALIKKADEMMYLAKRSGKNRARFYSDRSAIDFSRAVG